MAKSGVSVKRVQRTYEINGMHDPLVGHPSPMLVSVNGEETQLNGVLGSHHVAVCIAQLCAMADADANGVTDLDFVTPANLRRDQATGTSMTRKPLLTGLDAALKQLGKECFDSVQWP